jgi:hypothetical protein
MVLMRRTLSGTPAVLSTVQGLHLFTPASLLPPVSLSTIGRPRRRMKRGMLGRGGCNLTMEDRECSEIVVDGVVLTGSSFFR